MGVWLWSLLLNPLTKHKKDKLYFETKYNLQPNSSLLLVVNLFKDDYHGKKGINFISPSSQRSTSLTHFLRQTPLHCARASSSKHLREKLFTHGPLEATRRMHGA